MLLEGMGLWMNMWYGNGSQEITKGTWIEKILWLGNLSPQVEL